MELNPKNTYEFDLSDSQAIIFNTECKSNLLFFSINFDLYFRYSL